MRFGSVNNSSWELLLFPRVLKWFRTPIWIWTWSKPEKDDILHKKSKTSIHVIDQWPPCFWLKKLWGTGIQFPNPISSSTFFSNPFGFKPESSHTLNLFPSLTKRTSPHWKRGSKAWQLSFQQRGLHLLKISPQHTSELILSIVTWSHLCVSHSLLGVGHPYLNSIQPLLCLQRQSSLLSVGFRDLCNWPNPLLCTSS